MPDPLQYLAAMGAAALAAALLVAAIAWPRRAKQGQGASDVRVHLAGLAGMAGGLLAGYWVLDLYVSWPPANALDRFLTIILPLALGSELVAAFDRVPRWLAWTLRIALVAVMGRILLDGSVYLTGAHAAWEIMLQLAACAVLTANLWANVTVMAAHRSPAISVSIALALTMIGSGAVIMVSGYISGGAATLPFAAALVATVFTSVLLERRANVRAPVAIAVVGLSGLLLIGRYFGGLSTGVAIMLLFAPLLGWITGLPSLLRRRGSDVKSPS